MTTIQISDDVRKKLEDLKIHRREALNDVLERILEKAPNRIKPNDIQRLKEIAIPILRRYGVKKAALFGSFATGNAMEDSDVDLLIDTPEGIGLEIVDLELSLEKALGRKVDLVSYKFVDKYIKKRVMEEMKPIYG